MIVLHEKTRWKKEVISAIENNDKERLKKLRATKAAKHIGFAKNNIELIKNGSKEIFTNPILHKGNPYDHLDEYEKADRKVNAFRSSLGDHIRSSKNPDNYLLHRYINDGIPNTNNNLESMSFRNFGTINHARKELFGDKRSKNLEEYEKIVRANKERKSKKETLSNNGGSTDTSSSENTVDQSKGDTIKPPSSNQPPTKQNTTTGSGQKTPPNNPNKPGIFSRGVDFVKAHKKPLIGAGVIGAGIGAAYLYNRHKKKKEEEKRRQEEEQRRLEAMEAERQRLANRTPLEKAKDSIKKLKDRYTNK